MFEEGSPRRWRPVVAPAGTEHGAQLRMAYARELIGQGAASPVLDLGAAPLPQHPGERGGRGVLREQREGAAPRRRAGLEPAQDHAAFAGEALQQRVAVGAFRMRDAEGEAGQADDVVRVGAGMEAQAAVAQPGQQAAELPPGPGVGPDPADVVHAGREGPVLPVEDLGQPAGDGMLLQHQHPAAAPAQRRGSGQPADSGTDDDRIPHGFLLARLRAARLQPRRCGLARIDAGQGACAR